MSPHSPEKVLELARKFTESRILLTGAELDIFTLLAEKSLTAQEIVDKLQAHSRPMTILLDALSAMGLLVKQDGQYRTESALVSSLSSKSPDSILPMILHNVSLWKTWSGLTAIVMETGAPQRPAAIFRDKAELGAFIGAMHVAGAPQAARLTAMLDPEKYKTLLDVGGASGTYTLAFLQANQNLRATLFDKPEVVEMARERLGQAGVLDRVSLAPGDFHYDDLPPGHDLALLSAIIHQNDPEKNLDLYRKVYAALESGGRVIIRDHVMKSDRTEPRSGAVFAVNMLTATSGGGTYTFDEIKAGLIKAGFTGVNLLQEGEGMNCLVEAYKQ